MDHNLNELLMTFYEKKQKHHALKAESDAASEDYRVVEQEVLDVLEGLGIKTFTVELPGIGEVRFSRRKPAAC